MQTAEEIKHAFTPVNMDQVGYQKALNIQNTLRDAAIEVLENVPPCADRTHALRAILDAKFWCIQAISHQKPEVQVTKKPTKPEATNHGDEKEKTAQGAQGQTSQKSESFQGGQERANRQTQS